jgi:Lipocalin-like domain
MGRPQSLHQSPFIDQDGTVVHLEPGDFTLEPVPGQIWHSVASDADYPIAWTIRIPSLRIELEMSTPLKDQEMAAVAGGGTPAYWEGASRFRGTERGQPVEGKGYLEMLGYNQQGSGANSTKTYDQPWKESSVASGGEHSRPDVWSSSGSARQLSRFELMFPDLLRKLDAADRYRRGRKSLEPEHRPYPLFDSAMILLHNIVQVLTGAYSNSAQHGSR